MEKKLSSILNTLTPDQALAILKLLAKDWAGDVFSQSVDDIMDIWKKGGKTDINR